MVKWSWVLVTSTHVTDSLKCASVVWAAWLVPITPCSNQSAQTAITGGWNGCAGLKTVEGQKGRRWEWQNLTSRCTHTLNAGAAGDNCLKLLLQGMKYLRLQGSGTGSNSRFAPKINYGFSQNKLQPFMSSNYTSSVLLVLRCHYPAKSVAVKGNKVIKDTIPLQLGLQFNTHATTE